MSKLLDELKELDKEADSLGYKADGLKRGYEFLQNLRTSDTPANEKLDRIMLHSRQQYPEHTHAACKRVREHIESILPDLVRVTELEMQAAERKYKLQGLQKQAKIRAAIAPVAE